MIIVLIFVLQYIQTSCVLPWGMSPCGLHLYLCKVTEFPLSLLTLQDRKYMPVFQIKLQLSYTTSVK